MTSDHRLKILLQDGTEISRDLYKLAPITSEFVRLSYKRDSLEEFLFFLKAMENGSN